jgi:PAS domain S-box-containing protein
MRLNRHVTPRDYPLSEGDTLLSTSDLKGCIVYVNDAFVRVSGFGREELDGNAHGVVRHPDMSRATFEDMWTTIRGGLPWSSLLQNGRKDGEHCWVRSSASPIGPDATVVGVLTVRTEASNEEKHAHETLYQRINAGARHLNVHCGCVVGVHGLVELGQDIQQASREHALGVGKVNSAVAPLEQMAQQNVTLLPRSAEFGGSLTQHALHLDEAVPAFQPQGQER